MQDDPAIRQDGDGAAAAPAVDRFNCPACGAGLTVRATGSTVTMACEYCGSLIDLNDPRRRLIEKHDQLAARLQIPLGRRGTLDGIAWEVVGWVEKTDGSGYYSWEEYLLYNPWRGFRFLTLDRGHWALGAVVTELMQTRGRTAMVGDASYRHFLHGTAIVRRVVGEFYWRVRKGETVEVDDYVAPPEMISIETGKDEGNVTRLRYVTPAEMRAGFNVSSGPEGVAPAQPNPHAGGNLSRAVVTLGFIVAAIAIHNAIDRPKTVLYEQVAQLSTADRGQAFRLPNLTKDRPGALWFETSAPVQNSWLEVEYTVTHVESRESWSISQPVEYYHGREGGESWSEGGQQSRRSLSNLPAGTYDITVSADWSQAAIGEPASFAVSISQGPVDTGNLVVAILALLLLPLVRIYRRWKFETRRWANSDYGGGNE